MEQNVDLPETEQATESVTPVTSSSAPEASPAPSESAAEERARLEPAQGHTVTVKHLDAYYGEHRAIKQVDLEFPPNQVTAIIGPSGCGKSTLVRCINRMHEEIPKARAEGTILLDDEDIYASGRRCHRGSSTDRDGLPEGQPVPDDVDLRQRRLGAEARRDPRRRDA